MDASLSELLKVIVVAVAALAFVAKVLVEELRSKRAQKVVTRAATLSAEELHAIATTLREALVPPVKDVVSGSLREALLNEDTRSRLAILIKDALETLLRENIPCFREKVTCSRALEQTIASTLGSGPRR